MRLIFLSISIFFITNIWGNNNSQDTVIKNLVLDILKIRDSNVAEFKYNDSINVIFIRSLENSFSGGEITNTSADISFLFRSIYNNGYTLYTDNQECERMNKRLIVSWLSLALLSRDDRQWTFINYAKTSLVKAQTLKKEYIGLMLVEWLISEDTNTQKEIKSMVLKYLKSNGTDFTPDFINQVMESLKTDRIE